MAYRRVDIYFDRLGTPGPLAAWVWIKAYGELPDGNAYFGSYCLSAEEVHALTDQLRADLDRIDEVAARRFSADRQDRDL